MHHCGQLSHPAGAAGGRQRVPAARLPASGAGEASSPVQHCEAGSRWCSWPDMHSSNGYCCVQALYREVRQAVARLYVKAAPPVHPGPGRGKTAAAPADAAPVLW